MKNKITVRSSVIKKRIIIASIVIALTVVVGITASNYVLNTFENNRQARKEREALPLIAERERSDAVFSSTDAEDLIEESFFRKLSAEKGIEPRELFPEAMSEKQVNLAIHHMSHQKVKAHEKRGVSQLTKEKVEVLYNIVSNGDYDHKNLYLDILKRWSEGNFEYAHRDHNAVWNLLGGDVGVATGTASPEEEELYIKKNF
ncbi:hypothetical protein GCM10011351_11080 [Paraliobacillus quinghaiensis]|uniref:Uncharacterized protein n=1 Tax=Paraliobacillus quinghaiensis TaxID=470815 RepID=A0A917TKX0_9BACI|nr:DUF6241 domain-containing protein [Paraliobacillus quinghaiensis]GGM27094.1 hypothetical protein GCM10011351_11080 [Paraliobacillus quinghaiensis]